MPSSRSEALVLALFALVATPALAAGEAAKAPYSPYAARSYPARPYFGDTHLHTSFSMDAGAFGARLGPREAYVFAKGNLVTASSGQPVRLARPLDFLVVADHSDGMGFFPLLMSGSPAVLADPQGKKWYDLIQSGKGAEAAIDILADPDRAETMGQAGRARVLSHFSPEQIVPQYEALYAAVLKQPPEPFLAGWRP